ncbi:MAG: polymerase sigma-70 factor, subfamily [Frankiales bacterium]|jgi:RNA polymerase sigma-70 factor (ECF subfamily)|nr:polymerase sigma-70 factor, subfamily [Frankiales bacterium]
MRGFGHSIGVTVTAMGPARGSDGGAFEDAALIGRVAERDGAALEALYDRYGSVCYALAWRIVADDGLAEGVVLDVFRTIWEDAPRTDRARSGLAGWLLATTQHRAVEVVRREDNRKRRPSPTAVVALLSAAKRDDNDEAWWGLRRDRVRAALDQLSDADRDVLVLAYFGGYTQREIAGVTGLPFATIKSRMHVAMKALRQGLGDEEAAVTRPG